MVSTGLQATTRSTPCKAFVYVCVSQWIAKHARQVQPDATRSVSL